VHHLPGSARHGPSEGTVSGRRISTAKGTGELNHTGVTMNVLMIYPDLPPSFWSFPRALSYAGARAHFPPLGLITVAALLPESWSLRLADLNIRPLSEEDWVWCDLVMVSGMIGQREGMWGILREARARGKTTVCGGPYASAAPEELLAEGCDFVVLGEAENTVDRLLEALGTKGHDPIIRGDARCDMSRSPVPRFGLADLRAYSGFVVQASRGCPFRCEFCDIASLYGDRPRYKDPQQLTAELECLYGFGAGEFVFICDDNFIGNRRHALGILRGLIDWNNRRGRPFGFQTQASLNLARDREMIDLMVEANFQEVFIGVETPDVEILAASRKFVNTRHPLLESLDTLTRSGLSVQASFILGFDHETRGAGKRISDLVEAAGIPLAMLNVLNAPPSTRLWSRLEAEGRLLKDRGTGESTLTPLNFVPTRPEGEIMAEYVGAWEELYEPSRYLERAYRLCLALPPEPRRRSPGGPPHRGMRLRRPPGARPRWRDLVVLFRMTWELGIRPAYRATFWRYWGEILLRNPSRGRKYAIAAIMGLDLFDLRDRLRRRLRPVPVVSGTPGPSRT